METAIKRMKETAMKMKRTASWLSKVVVIALVAAGGLLGISTSATAATDYGYPGNSYTGVSNPPTSDKPQSKLWWHDGSWWADMWTSGTGWQIYRLDVASKTWVSTGLTNDTRANTLADAFWDGTHLYIASHVVTVSGDTTPRASVSGQPARLYRYSYSGGAFKLDSGFPSTIMNNSSESMTIDQDSTGAIWATWTQVSGSAGNFTNTVYVNRSAPGGTSWNTPFVIPVDNPNPAPDDISALVAYNGNKIGVMWSDQLTGSVRWATHTDGTSPTAASAWKVQDAVKGTKYADDHLNVKTLQSDDAGRVFAAIKTGLNDNETDQSLAQVELLVFKPGTGSFSVSTIATIEDCVSRPQIVLDTENNTVHAFHTAPGTDVSGCAYSGIAGAIYEKTADMDNPEFESGRGTPIIQDGASDNMNDVTTSKQSVDSTTGIVVLASNNVTKRYWFSYQDLGDTADESAVATPLMTTLAANTPALGTATGAVTCGLKDGGCSQSFQGGDIHWSPASGAHATTGGIRTTWQANGAENGQLGYPTGEETGGLRNGGVAQTFQGGAIVWSPTTGSQVSMGGIRTTWLQNGAENGQLGYPTSKEITGLRNGGVMQYYQGGAIVWSPASGSQVSMGAIRVAWASTGYENGRLGYPISREYPIGGGAVAQDYQGGRITWTPGRGATIS
jgi:hypothetical protein